MRILKNICNYKLNDEWNMKCDKVELNDEIYFIIRDEHVGEDEENEETINNCSLLSWKELLQFTNLLNNKVWNEYYEGNLDKFDLNDSDNNDEEEEYDKDEEYDEDDEYDDDDESNEDDEYDEDDEDDENDEYDEVEDEMVWNSEELRVITVDKDANIVTEHNSCKYMSDLEKVFIVFYPDNAIEKCVAYWDDENDEFVVDDDTYDDLKSFNFFKYIGKVETIKPSLPHDVSRLLNGTQGGTFDNDWAVESILKKNGYTVNKKDNLDDDQRQAILKRIIYNKLLTKGQVVNYLEWFIAYKENRPNMREAVEKWKRDLEFVKKLK